jgi:hypothetical protein
VCGDAGVAVLIGHALLAVEGPLALFLCLFQQTRIRQITRRNRGVTRALVEFRPT